MNNNYHRRPQDDLPYEQHMKHIIEGYHYLWNRFEKLEEHARRLELQNTELKDKLSICKYEKNSIHSKLIEKRREVKRLRAHIDWLEEQSQKDG